MRRGICNWMLRSASAEGSVGLRYRKAPLMLSARAHTTATHDQDRNFSRRIKCSDFQVQEAVRTSLKAKGESWSHYKHFHPCEPFTPVSSALFNVKQHDYFISNR